MHTKPFIKRFIASLVFVLLHPVIPVAASGEDTTLFRFMFYNTENLFDVYNDPLTADDDFLPAGAMRWTITRYKKKINSLYKTIIAAGEWEPPAFVAMCEVENRKVLNDLVKGTNLAGYDYGIIHEDSPDTRGIDVCLIYRKDLIRIPEYRSIIPKPSGKEFHSRSILYAKCVIHDDTLHVLVNHWPSRRGGILAGEDLRERISLTVSMFIDSLIGSGEDRKKIIITGDMNCNPEENAVMSLINRLKGKDNVLVNLTRRGKSGVQGTYRFQGAWELFDQIIVSEELINSEGGLFTTRDSFRIFDADFLLTDDPRYPGQMPFPTYRGYRYQGGFSDHLPVLIDLHYK